MAINSLRKRCDIRYKDRQYKDKIGGSMLSRLPRGASIVTLVSSVRAESVILVPIASFGVPTKLKGGAKRLLDKGFVRAEDLAKRFGVSVTTIHQWGRRGLLRRQRYDNDVRCLYEPVDSLLITRGKGGRKPKQPVLVTA